MVERIINLPKKNSFFLFGPRQTGKSTLINTKYTNHIWKINLLLSDIYFSYSKDPALFRREAIEKITNENIGTIFIDEIQRIPMLLNEVHYLMENYPNCQFILTGSSARKLKRGGVNLLAGRAIERRLFPFTFDEIKEDFNLDGALRYGTLPPLLHKSDDEKRDILNAYVNVYLREEIQSEGIARNIGGFSRFLDIAAFQFGELVNYSAIARECSLPVRTVQSYYDILEDTLIGFRLQPWRKSIRKRLSSHAKFYFFDIGIINAINKSISGDVNLFLKGRLFEHFIILETYRKISYLKSDANLYFWRTNHGAEVDLLIEKQGKLIAAFEIKSTSKISGAHLSGLRAFKEENLDIPCKIISQAPHAYSMHGINILPWKKYLENLHEWL